MVYIFAGFELDIATFELRASGIPVPVEPQVYALLRLLVENRERMVTKDEIVERIWNGRSISDAAVASRIKSARQAVGDDGRAQRVIRTIHGLGFRFVAEVTTGTAASVSRTRPDTPDATRDDHPQASRPSIAVLPFRLVGVAGPLSGIADGLPQDLITELSRLHWLFVIARESSFLLRAVRMPAWTGCGWG